MKKITLFLLYLYSFSLPFTGIIEKLFYYSTYLKPFRVIAFSLFFFSMLLFFETKTKIKFSRYDFINLIIIVIGIFNSFLWNLLKNQDMSWALNGMLIVAPSIAVYIVIINLGLSNEEKLRILQIYIIANVINASYGLLDLTSLKLSDYRLSALSRVSDNFGMNCGIALLFILADLSDTNYRKNIIKFISLLILLIGIIWSGTRGVYIALGICLIFFFSNKIYSKSIRPVLILIIVPLLIIFTYTISINPESWQKITERYDTNSPNLLTGAGRTELWLLTPQIIFDHYLLGAGIYGYMSSMGHYFSKLKYFTVWDAPEKGLVAHNNYITVLVDFGFFGLLLLLVNTRYFFIKIWKKLKNYSDNYYRLSFSIFIASVFFVLYAFVADLWNFPEYWFILALSSVIINKNE